MLKHRADYRTLAFISIYFLLVTFQWNWNFESPWARAAILALTCFWSWLAAVITHNTLHAPIFVKRWMNRIFQVVLTVTYGFPVSEYVPGHNLSHHQFTQYPEDCMRTSKVRSRVNLLNILYFVPRVAPDVTKANMQFIRFMRGRNSGWFRQYLVELSVCWGSKLVLLAVDWRKALLLIFLPHACALWGITAVNYLQHDGCDVDHEFNHSRNFVGGFFNWVTFNNGYHGMHHRKPGLHWSLLPEAHAREMHAGIHPALEQRSLLVYLFRAFIYPGKRLRYDGKPVILPPLEADQDRDWLHLSRAENVREVVLENNLGGGAASASA